MATITRAQAPSPTQEQSRARARVRIPWRTAGIYLLFLVVCILRPLPDLLDGDDLVQDPARHLPVPSLFPTAPTLDNYHTLLGKKHFLVNIRNSIIVAAAATLISVFISALCAYSLVRLKYRWRG